MFRSVDLPHPDGPRRAGQAHVLQGDHGVAAAVGVGLRHVLEDDAHGQAPARSRKRWIFPVAVFGSSGTKATTRGTL